MYKEGRSESRQANYLYSRVLSRQDSVAFLFLVHLAETMLGHMIPFVPILTVAVKVFFACLYFVIAFLC
jgi:hypothetical protein